MRPAKDIEKLIKKLNITASPRMHDRTISDILEAQEKSKKPISADSQPNIWRIIMKSRITKFAAVAVIIIASLIGINQFGVSIDGAQVAFAKVIKAIEKIPCVRSLCRVNTTDIQHIKGFIVDINETPVARAKIYRIADFIYDANNNKLCASENTKIMAQTDTNGAFFFDLPKPHGRQRSLFLVLDESLRMVGYLQLLPQQPNETYSVILRAAARIKMVLASESIPMNNFTVTTDFNTPQTNRGFYPCIKVTYKYGKHTNLIPVDVLSIPGCGLLIEVQMTPDDWTEPINIEIPPLKPGEVHDLGKLKFKPVAGYSITDKKAPELQVAEWVKSKPVTLGELKGKVVLLDFWGLWCGPCREAFVKLIELHNKYHKDGLVVIGIHDSSKCKKDIINAAIGRFRFSDIPFRIAIDSPISRSPIGNPGTGRTIQSYGISVFPSLILVSKDGKVERFGRDLEKHVNLMLYGDTKRLYTQQSLKEKVWLAAYNNFLLIVISCLVLLLTGLYLVLRLTIRPKEL